MSGSRGLVSHDPETLALLAGPRPGPHVLEGAWRLDAGAGEEAERQVAEAAGARPSAAERHAAGALRRAARAGTRAPIVPRSGGLGEMDAAPLCEVEIGDAAGRREGAFRPTAARHEGVAPQWSPG